MILLLLIGPVGTGFLSMLKARDPEVLSAAAMCSYFAIKNSSGNIVMATPIFYLVMICFGTLAGWCWSPHFAAPRTLGMATRQIFEMKP